MGETIRVSDFDHLVLNVSDVERSLGFYCGDLGLEPLRADEWHRHEVPFPSIRISGTTIIDLVQLPRGGENCDHFCLVVEPTDFDELKRTGRFEVVEGPDRRFGARGDGTSLYIRDPDHNLVELRYYDA
jgi:catechol 2,3-dioxygenase-like lactoylglutathione lyase family enzyme